MIKCGADDWRREFELKLNLETWKMQIPNTLNPVYTEATTFSSDIRYKTNPTLANHVFSSRNTRSKSNTISLLTIAHWNWDICSGIRILTDCQYVIEGITGKSIDESNGQCEQWWRLISQGTYSRQARTNGKGVERSGGGVWWRDGGGWNSVGQTREEWECVAWSTLNSHLIRCDIVSSLSIKPKYL